MSTLTGRVAIVTGATAGIGRATAQHLAAQGAAVVLMGRRESLLRELATQLEKKGSRALAVAGDAAQVADIERLLSQAQQFSRAVASGKIDIVIVNAGRGLAGGLLTSDEAQWRQMYDVNVLGAAALMRRAGEILVQQGSGDIVALGSASGHNVSPFSGFYGSTKFALAGMVEAFRREVCARGVRVTLVMPGIVESEFQQVAGYTPENFFKGVARFGTLLKPDDIAATITFVVSQPPHVHINELVIRPTGQDYP